MNQLRQQFLNALAAPKILVSKSAAPDMVTVYGPMGDVIGFGQAETVSPAEALQLAETPNDLFDDSPAFPFAEIEQRQQVQKSVPHNSADPNDCLSGLFPFQDVSKSASPTGSELMNRVAGRNTEETGGPEGRPRTKSKLPTPQAPAAGATIQIVEGVLQGESILKAGSVLTASLPDGTEVAFAVLNDVPVELLD